MAAPVLFHLCDATTSLRSLHIWRRGAAMVIVGCFASSVAMAEGVASLIAFGPSEFAMMHTLAAGTLGALLALPAILLFPLVGKIERELRCRGELPNSYVSIAERIPGYTIYMLAWSSAAIVASRWLT